LTVVAFAFWGPAVAAGEAIQIVALAEVLFIRLTWGRV
jgi:hypothetical protein